MADNLGYEPYERLVAIGVNLDGERDVLGLWLGPSAARAPSKWMSMLSEPRNRGIADALIVCYDGPKGLPDAIPRDMAARDRADLRQCISCATACVTPQ